MALNPFFQQGSPNEQYLVQDLINEHIRMFGIEVYYIPRKLIDVDNILREVNSSKFDDNFIIEAYLNNYDGYGGQGDIMTKFGVSLRDEVDLIISRERFEEFISPFLNARLSNTQNPLVSEDYDDGGDLFISSRPKEGDLIYFPLGQRLFEIKFVEHENPFYQLGKNYVYELKCELYEYEDEVLDTSIEEIDTVLEDEGQITTLQLQSSGSSAQAFAYLGSGIVQKLNIITDGYGYKTAPDVIISPSDSFDGTNATAFAEIYRGSLKNVYLTNTGSGYTKAPTVSIVGGEGKNAKVTASLIDDNELIGTGIRKIEIQKFGSGYVLPPTVTISPPNSYGAKGLVTINGIGSITSTQIQDSGQFYDPNKNPEILITPNTNTSQTASAISRIGVGGSITSINVTNPGLGYTQPPSIIVGNGSAPIGGSLGIVSAILSQTDGSILSISVINPGYGYTIAPFLNISPPKEFRKASLKAIVSAAGTISSISILDPGIGYTSVPTISIGNSISDKIGLEQATAKTIINQKGEVTGIIITNSGVGYTSRPSISFSNPPTVGVGTFFFNEIVTGSTSKSKARVKEWDADTKTLKISIISGSFISGESIVGTSSSARYTLKNYDSNDVYDKYSQNDEIEEEADLIVDFSESNPFGTY
jgi:hypothetical protein